MLLEAIQAEEDALEVQETEAAIEETGEIEVQSEVVEELQEQDAAIEEKLETPAEVTPEDVAVAQEASRSHLVVWLVIVKFTKAIRV